jgi:hypothetical protein
VSFVGSALVYIHGMSRCARERYQVHLLDERSGIARAIVDPPATFYADPFVFTHNGETWLFCEAFECATNRGHIAAARVSDTREIGPLARVLDPGCHASFPFVFENEGSAYLLPETSRAKCVDLYVCEAMPERWRVAERLLEGVDCADSVLYRRDGLWYLVTSETDEHTSPNRWLSIYCSDTLLSRRWTPHPVNRERRYADRAHGYGRNAGAIVEAGTDLLRPMQASTEYYGQSARVMRIYALTPERYAEGPYEGGHIIARIASEHSTHHISTASGLVAWDTRTHVGYFRRVRT